MANPWDADIDLTAEQAAHLIESHFPEFAPVSLRDFGKGWDNQIFEANGQWLFRFPRREVALPLLMVERLFLPRAAPHLPLPVPNPNLWAEPSEDFPFPFLGYRALSGQTACRANPSKEARLKQAEPLAAFLKALHGLTLKDLELPPDDYQRASVRETKTKIRAQLEIIGAHIPPDLFEKVNALNESPIEYKSKRQVPVHGDLYVRHLLVENDELRGVIDWGDCHLGDPAVDLAIAWSYLPIEAHEPFRAAYGPISEDTWRMARLRALFYGAILTRFGYGSDDEALIRESRHILEKVTAFGPF